MSKVYRNCQPTFTITTGLARNEYDAVIFEVQGASTIIRSELTPEQARELGKGLTGAADKLETLRKKLTGPSIGSIFSPNPPG